MALSALDDAAGAPVDWWFAYKLPLLKNPTDAAGTALGESAGTGYLYCDARAPALPRALSPHAAILQSGAIVDTLKQLRAAAAQPGTQIGWFIYNDEFPKVDHQPIPGLPRDNDAHGHSKGVLAFDLASDTAFWLLHSWPCWPSMTPADDPSPDFGQTFVCITLKDVATADAIAGLFHDQSQPQIIGMSVPALDPARYPNLVQLAQDLPIHPMAPGSATPAEIDFVSRGGQSFKMFAKSKDWLSPARDKVQPEKDLYSDLIGPALGVDLEVETWQDGEPDEDSDRVHTTQDIPWIDLRSLGLNFAWHFVLHDHAKWAVSRDPDSRDETDWVIVADINRISSQYKRGGTGIAWRCRPLAQSLHAIIHMVPPPADEAVIAGHAASRGGNSVSTRATGAATSASSARSPASPAAAAPAGSAKPAR